MEKPILFNTEMVKAILEGRKTQTRRLVKPHIVDRFVLSESGNLLGSYIDGETDGYPTIDDCPYQSGDIILVRETWCELVKEHIIDGQKYAYKANTGSDSDRCRKEYIECGYPYQWRPSIHMPKEAARLFLKVTSVRVERLQDITAEDIRSEGLTSMGVHCLDYELAVAEWKLLWDSIYKSHGYGWDVNPWVWVIEFEKVGA